MARHDWEVLRRDFITDPNKPSTRAFAKYKGLVGQTVANRAAKENWVQLRDEYWYKVGTKTEEKLSDFQAHQIATDTADRLTEIRLMQEAALRSAGGTPGSLVSYEKPHEAVAAYEKLVKLERLLTDQSTENLSVADGKQVVTQLFQILREEVSDHATLERIAGRLAELGGAAARVGPPADSLN